MIRVPGYGNGLNDFGPNRYIDPLESENKGLGVLGTHQLFSHPNPPFKFTSGA